MADIEPEDERGYWTITVEGGPATAANLAVTLRSMVPRSWAGRMPSSAGFVERLAVALDQARFTPVREIPIRRRDPAEARALMIAGGIPADIADEIAAT